MPDNDVNKEDLSFLFDDDLLSVLETLNLKDDFLGGNLKCTVCSRVINKDNFSGFYKEGTKLKFLCDDKKCLDKNI